MLDCLAHWHLHQQVCPAALACHFCSKSDNLQCRYSPSKAGTPRCRSDLMYGYGIQPHARSPLGRHMHPTPSHHRPTPTKCCSSFGSQPPKRGANAVGQDSEQQRGIEGEKGAGCKGSQEGSVGVLEQEQGAGYVDIPRRVAWERLGCGRKNHALQVGPMHIYRVHAHCSR